VPPRSRAETAPAAPSTMKELKDTLWKAADKLRGSMDASQYKDVILGLVFLKYVSDAFDEQRARIRSDLAAEGYDEEQIARLIDDVDEYTGAGVFWIPEEARWSFLAQNAKGRGDKTIGGLIDSAMEKIMDANPALEATLPRMYNRGNVDQRRLGELLALFNSARFTGQGVSKARDLLGEVYEYFLEKFARAEGKRGGEFYTPASVVRVLVEVLEPTAGRVYDPCCGSGPQRAPHRDLGVRPGAQRAHLADGEDEPRHPRAQRQPRPLVGRHLRARSASPAHRRRGRRLRARQSPVQHQGLGAQRERPPLALRRAARRQRELRLDPAHPVQAQARRERGHRHGERVDVDQLRR
jgi:hypothetical protein